MDAQYVCMIIYFHTSFSLCCSTQHVRIIWNVVQGINFCLILLTFCCKNFLLTLNSLSLAFQKQNMQTGEWQLRIWGQFSQTDNVVLWRNISFHLEYFLVFVVGPILCTLFFTSAGWARAVLHWSPAATGSGDRADGAEPVPVSHLHKGGRDTEGAPTVHGDNQEEYVSIMGTRGQASVSEWFWYFACALKWANTPIFYRCLT